MIPVSDSNILIDITLGRKEALKELHRYTSVAISVISWVEVMSGAKNSEEEEKLTAFLALFDIVPMDMALARKASRIRKQFRLKLPDAIILATAELRGTLLVTRNSKDFPRSNPAIRIPYQL